ncbi:MAG: hypothetical protein JXA22_01470 [Candidatus Thermoplasmatota archaeon]|nr:hypothetical protein [Candidatus Thermoplasmatota archaeon]
MKLQMLVPIVLLAAVAFSGCLGGGDGGDDQPEYTVMSDTMDLSGTQTGLAQATPVDIFAVVPVLLEYDTVIKMQVNISVLDNDVDTEADSVGTIELNEVVTEGEGNSTTINGGNTPVTQQLVVEWQNGEYLSSSWEIYIPVTMNAGADQWPGPFIWSGVPDRGFSYSIQITIEYHAQNEE